MIATKFGFRFDGQGRQADLVIRPEHITGLRRGLTAPPRRSPVTIWVVRHGDDLYARSYRGPGGPAVHLPFAPFGKSAVDALPCA